jgi:photosynthetic reaction center cytochrome c subunit
MPSNRGAMVRRFAIVTAVLAAATTLIAGKPAQAPPNSSGPKTAVQAFKNILVLKDIPADQLIPSMQFIANSLGVECDFCHVEGAFDKDDKEEKKTARKMMTMMIAINQQNFEGKKEVSCNTCHRGNPHPQGIPVITAELREPVNTEAMEHEHHHDHEAQMPSADPVIDAYVKAVGGNGAIAKLKSATEKASMAMGPGKNVEVEIYEEIPDRRVSVVHMPGGGDSVTAYNGSEGWLSFPKRPLREMNGDERYAAKLDAEFLVPSDPRKAFTEFKSAKPDTINGKEVNVVLGINPNQPPVKLYFDKQTGLLVRMLRYANTPLGFNPTQVDFADYRDRQGAKIPFEWTIARPLGRFTMKVESFQLNAPIDGSKFAKPAAPAEPPAH